MTVLSYIAKRNKPCFCLDICNAKDDIVRPIASLVWGVTPLFEINWRASVASETLTGVTQSKIGDVYLASERSERDTYRGKNEKIGDVCLLASERSERDTYRGNTIENRGCLFIYLFIYIYGRTYVIAFLC